MHVWVKGEDPVTHKSHGQQMKQALLLVHYLIQHLQCNYSHSHTIVSLQSALDEHQMVHGRGHPRVA